MWRLDRFSFSRFLLVFGALAATLGGCIVNTGASRALIEVQWQPTGGTCAQLGIDTVRIRVDRNGAFYSDIANIACAKGSQSLSVPEGNYSVKVEGMSAQGVVIAETPWQDLTALAGYSQPTGVMPLQLIAQATGGVGVSWTVLGESAMAGCGKQGIHTVIVSILDEAKAAIVASIQVPCSAGQATVLNVPVGNAASAQRYVQLDGVTQTNTVTWGNVSLYGPVTVYPGATTVVPQFIDLAPLQAASPGAVAVGWTVFGQPAAQGCAQFKLEKVDVRVLDQARTIVLAAVQAPCSAGFATVPNVPAGPVWIQLDGVGPQTADSYGNINLTGPVQVVSGSTAKLSTPVDIGKRTVLSLDWAFANGGSCASNGVGTVYVEIRNSAEKVVVPMNDPFAAKPCSIGPSSAYADRVIDMAYTQPICAIPPGAKGLVLCNIQDSTVGIAISGAQGNSITYGGSMQVKQIIPGTHVPIATPLYLAPCSASNPCTAP